MSKILKRRIDPIKNISPVSIAQYRNGWEGFVKWCEDFVYISIYQEGSDVASWCPLRNLPKKKNPRTNRSPNDFWQNVKEALREALQMKDNRFKHRLIILCWQRGESKCERKGSRVLMYDGTVKKVEDVAIGDLLMGDDNTPRKVLSLKNGKEELFEIKPNRGESLFVTGDHVLSLKKKTNVRHKTSIFKKNEEYGKIIDISVNDFQKQSNYFKNNHMLFRIPIEFPEQELKIDPYFLGLWLGDRVSTYPSITTMNKEIVEYIEWYAKEIKQTVSVQKKIKTTKETLYSIVENDHQEQNHLLNLLREYNLIENKHIPQEYKINSRENRMKLLAGLIDSDSCLNRKFFCIITKRKVLCDDILFLARSLGFYAEATKIIGRIKKLNFEGEYYRIGISGDYFVIPTRLKVVSSRRMNKDILLSNIKEIKSVGKQEYYGFMLDGNGRYVRGDFTVTHNSLAACLIQLWKFFNWPRQQIMLGANSKDQVKFVHFDIMRDIILNSPALLDMVGGQKNIQEKEIRLTDRNGNVKSIIRSISSFSGIVSNITGYTFSEIFDMKNPKFFVQLDGSIRNIPNALGVIDSTVSSKDHILYKLYISWLMQKTTTIYFSYRYSLRGQQEDYWNPNMDQAQLEDYRSKFPFGEFERYFQNLWEASSQKVFTKEIVDEIGFLGADNTELNHEVVTSILNDRKNAMIAIDNLQNKITSVHEFNKNLTILQNKIKNLESRLMPMDKLYKLCDSFSQPKPIGLDALMTLSNHFQTDFAILAGLDMADPFAKHIRARSVVTVVAKGLPNSRTNPHLVSSIDLLNPRYIYFLVGVFAVPDNSLDLAKDYLEEVHWLLDGIDVLCSERYGSWDMLNWGEEKGIMFEHVFPTYDKQREAFKELFLSIHQGRFKSPKLYVPGTKTDNILTEELLMFDHDQNKKWFGSPEKNDSHGVQDDTIFSLMWCLYGGRNLTSYNFRSRNLSNKDFGNYYQKEKLYGTY